MTSEVLALACPGCGGTLVVGQSSRVVTCPYCKHRKLVCLDGLVPRYLAEPRVDAEAARRAMHAALDHPDLPRRLAAEVRIRPPRLFRIPFYELSGQRVGRVVVDRERTERESVREVEPGGSARWITQTKVVTVEDTKVVLAHVSFTHPAVALSAWGIERLTPARTRADGGGLRPFEPTDDIAGTAFEPTVAVERVRELAAQSTAGRQSEVAIIDQQLILIYYPVWQSTYVYDGRLHQIIIDGVDGSLVRAEAPLDPRRLARGQVAAAALFAAAAAGATNLAADFSRTMLRPDATSWAWMVAPIALAIAIAGVLHVTRSLAETREIVLPTARPESAQ